MHNNLAIFDEKNVDTYLDYMFPAALMMVGLLVGPSIWLGAAVFCIIPLFIGIMVVGCLTHATFKMSGKQKRVYDRVKVLKKKMGDAAPDIPVDVILAMEPQDASDVLTRLNNLFNAYESNKKALKVRDARIADVKDMLSDRAAYYHEHTKELNKFDKELT